MSPDQQGSVCYILLCGLRLRGDTNLEVKTMMNAQGGWNLYCESFRLQEEFPDPISDTEVNNHQRPRGLLWAWTLRHQWSLYRLEIKTPPLSLSLSPTLSPRLSVSLCLSVCICILDITYISHILVQTWDREGTPIMPEIGYSASLVGLGGESELS